MKEKQVLLPEGLFVDLYKYHVLGTRDPAMEERIRAGMDKKGDALYRRALYTDYKQGDEDARQKYLDEKGVPEEFRW